MAPEEQIALEQALEQALEPISSDRGLLQWFLAIYQVLEPQVLRTPGLDRWVTDLTHHHKIRDLLTALKALHHLPDAQLSATPAPTKDAPGALGCLYMLEGSTLGDQLIARLVTQRLRLTPEHGCRFFAGAGRNTSELWKSFARYVESLAAAHPECRRQIAQSALASFARFASSVASWSGENLLVHDTSLRETV